MPVKPLRRLTMKRMRRDRKVSSPFHVAGLLVSACCVLQPRTSNAQPSPCPQGSAEVGYATIAAINSDMQDELAKIQGGASPQSQYTFNLCSQTKFDTSGEPLRPVLSNSFFVCGVDGKSSNLCTFEGGPVQVDVTDSSVSNYPLTDITVSGMTFAGFTGVSINASASLPTNLNLLDVVFTGFNAEFVIRQTQRNSGQSAMSVALSNVAINSATVGSVFVNDGGQLTISNLLVEDVDAASLVSTSNEGTSFLQDSFVSNSAMDSITTTSTAAAQSVIGVVVNNMRRLKEAYTVSGSLSGLAISTSSVSGNNITLGTSWSGVVVRSGASATVNNFEMSRNAGVEFGVSVSSTDSRLAVKESQFVMNHGTVTSGVSSPAITLSKSSLTIERTVFSGNRGFSGEVLALVTSSLSLAESCIQGGEARFVVFVDATSNYSSSLNYLNNYLSVECSEAQDPALRLFKENPGSGCFIGTNICEGTCEVLADQSQCPIQNGTRIPTASPTSTNTTAPTLAPTTQAAPTTRKPTNCRKSKKGKGKKASKGMQVSKSKTLARGKGKGEGAKSSGSKIGASKGKGSGKGGESKSLNCYSSKLSKGTSSSKSSSWSTSKAAVSSKRSSDLNHDRRATASLDILERPNNQRSRIRDDHTRRDLRGTTGSIFIADPLGPLL